METRTSSWHIIRVLLIKRGRVGGKGVSGEFCIESATYTEGSSGVYVFPSRHRPVSLNLDESGLNKNETLPVGFYFF